MSDRPTPTTSAELAKAEAGLERLQERTADAVELGFPRPSAKALAAARRRVRELRKAAS